MRKRALGAEYPDTLTSANNLAASMAASLSDSDKANCKAILNYVELVGS